MYLDLEILECAKWPSAGSFSIETSNAGKWSHVATVTVQPGERSWLPILKRQLFDFMWCLSHIFFLFSFLSFFLFFTLILLFFFLFFFFPLFLFISFLFISGLWHRKRARYGYTSWLFSVQIHIHITYIKNIKIGRERERERPSIRNVLCATLQVQKSAKTTHIHLGPRKCVGDRLFRCCNDVWIIKQNNGCARRILPWFMLISLSH